MEEPASHDEAHSISAVVKHDVVEMTHEIPEVPIQFSSIKIKSENIPGDTNLDPVEINEIAEENAVPSLADSKFETLFMKTESEEFLHTIKEEVEDLDEKQSNSSEMKQENIEIEEEFRPIPLEFLYLNCKSEVEDNFANTADGTTVRQDLTNPTQNDIAGKIYSEEPGQNTCKCPASTQQQSCNMCHREFPVPIDFRSHRYLHEEHVLGSLVKDTCVSVEQTLINSIESHTDANFHLSSECGKKNSDKIFPCNVCGKSFKQKGNLNQHMSIHTGNKPFSCNVCSKSFTQKSTFNNHMSIHNDKKPFSCNMCGKSFNRKNYLTEHMSNHTGYRPFSCIMCGKSYKRKENLTEHLSIHSGKKPFTCNVCNKSFTHKSTLNNHMSIHNDEKPFSCTVCHKSFKRKCELTQHSSIHAH